jgi:hypothetical protein
VVTRSDARVRSTKEREESARHREEEEQAISSASAADMSRLEAGAEADVLRVAERLLNREAPLKRRARGTPR